MALKYLCSSWAHGQAVIAKCVDRLHSAYFHHLVLGFVDCEQGNQLASLLA